MLLHDENSTFTNLKITKALGNDPVMRDWIVNGLQNDTHSIENALLIESSAKSCPLLIDPTLSGTKWLRLVEREKLVVLRFDQSDFLQRIKSCTSFRLPILIENVGMIMDLRKLTEQTCSVASF